MLKSKLDKAKNDYARLIKLPLPDGVDDLYTKLSASEYVKNNDDSLYFVLSTSSLTVYFTLCDTECSIETFFEYEENESPYCVISYNSGKDFIVTTVNSIEDADTFFRNLCI